MATVHQTNPQQPASLDPHPAGEQMPELIIYSHSNLSYWWPIWLSGYVFALLTYFQGQVVQVGQQQVYMHPSKNLGVYFTLIFSLVILLTNVSLRGLVSVLVVVLAAFFAVLFAWLDWWDDIMQMLPYLAIYMNMGFYVVFSTAMFVIWALAFFVFDRMKFWRVRPGQMTYERFIGGGEKSYDTRGMVFEKHLEDLFKHHILGFGSGDIRISTAGARREELYIPNVLFVDRKVAAIQRLISIKPTDVTETVVTAGTPG
jgi:hypothetical protein